MTIDFTQPATEMQDGTEWEQNCALELISKEDYKFLAQVWNALALRVTSDGVGGFLDKRHALEVMANLEPQAINDLQRFTAYVRKLNDVA